MNQSRLSALNVAIQNNDCVLMKKIFELLTLPSMDSFPTISISMKSTVFYLQNQLEYKNIWISGISTQNESTISTLHEMNIPWPCVNDLIGILGDSENIGVLTMLRFLKKNQLIDDFSSKNGPIFGKRTFLECFSKNGNIAAVTYLLNFCLVSKEDINNSFVVACRYGRVGIVFLLVEYVDHVDVKDTVNHSTALMHAAQQNHISVVGLLLERGADPFTMNEETHKKARDYTANVVIIELLYQNEKKRIAENENKNDSEILPSVNTTPDETTLGGIQEEKTEGDEMDVPICESKIPCEEIVSGLDRILNEKVMELLEKLWKEEKNAHFDSLKKN